MLQRGVRFMPALDGLRALAVIAVLLYHGNVSWARGGYFGVDAFFVLSGFLITTLLLTEWRETGTIDLKGFWTRRARRLLPALTLVVAGVAVYAAWYASPIELHQLRRDAFSTLGYVANWNQIVSHQSYFEQFAAPSALRHTWSLAIEEQFYLVWPLLVLGVLRVSRGSRRVLFGGCALLAGASASLMALWFRPGTDPSRVYYGTDTRAQALLIGAMLAIVLARREQRAAPPRAPRVLHGAALGAIVALGWIWTTTGDHDAWQYRGGFALVACLVAVVIASASHPAQSGVIVRALAWRPLRSIGTISYGVYLWHWPLYVALTPDRTGLDGTPLLLVRLTTTFVIATASFYLVEWPICRGFFSGWRVRAGIPAIAAALAIAIVASTARPVPQEFQSFSAAAVTPPLPLPVARHAATRARPLRVMLVGDSVAASIAPGLQAEARIRGIEFWSGAIAGCGLASDVGERWTRQWLAMDPRCLPPWRVRWPRQLARFQPDVVIGLFGAQDTFDRRINGAVIPFDAPAGADLAQRDLRDAVAKLSSTGAKIILLTTPYYRLGWPMTIDLDRSSMHEPWIDRYNLLLRSAAQQMQRSSASVLDLNRYVDPGGAWTDTVNGIKVRGVDRMHFSAAGADFVAKWLIAQLPRRAAAEATTSIPTPHRAR